MITAVRLRHAASGRTTRLLDVIRPRRGLCLQESPPGELERMVAGLGSAAPTDLHSDDGLPGELLVGLDDGDDAAVVRLDGGRAVIVTPTSSAQSWTTPMTGAG